MYLLLIYVVWGSTYLFIRLAVRDETGFPPFTMAAMRAFAAGLVLLAWAVLRRQRLRVTRGEMVVLAVSGCLLWVGGNGLVVWAEQEADSGYAALMVSTMPIWVATVEAVLDRRAPSVLLVGGLLVGLAGVGLLSGPALAEGRVGSLAAVLALLGAALSWAVGSVLQRRRPVGVAPLVSASYLLLIGSVWLALTARLAGEPLPHPSAEAWLAWGYLVLVGTLVGFTSFIQALHLLPTSVVMTYAYVNPVIAVVLGAVFLGEPITVWTLGGMALVLAGVAGVFRDRYGGAKE